MIGGSSPCGMGAVRLDIDFVPVFCRNHMIMLLKTDCKVTGIRKARADCNLFHTKVCGANQILSFPQLHMSQVLMKSYVKC